MPEQFTDQTAEPAVATPEGAAEQPDTDAQPDAAAQDFLGPDDPYRGELLAHCYRMLGSVHDAEDLVQETYLRAWRSYHKFEGRSSVRTWLYRIATNACLTAIESRGKRPLPTGLGQPSSDPAGELQQSTEVPWLEPFPDTVVAKDPATVVAERESIRLAFVAALQHLPPRQRAVLILRDVLKWRAAEVAQLLDMTTVAVNSALQRAHAQLGDLTEEQVTELDDKEKQQLLDRYVKAFEEYDMDTLLKLFTEDAVWEMPPFTGWYQGAQDIVRLISTHCPAERPGDMRMIPTSANGQPAFGLYMRGPDGVHRAFQLQVLTLDSNGAVSHVGSFFDVSLFAKFGLPEVHPAGGVDEPAPQGQGFRMHPAHPLAPQG